LTDGAARQRIAERGYRAAIHAHTVQHRAAQIVARMTASLGPTEGPALAPFQTGYVLYRTLEPLRYGAARVRAFFS
jgi:hypothetical protein